MVDVRVMPRVEYLSWHSENIFLSYEIGCSDKLFLVPFSPFLRWKKRLKTIKHY